MGLEKTIEKLGTYLERQKKGKAKKIKPEDVEKVERKLKAKKKMLMAELDDAHKGSKKDRLKGKLAVVNDQLERAKWLGKKVSKK